MFGAEISHGLDGIDGDGDTVPSPWACFMPLVWVEGDSRQCEIFYRSIHSAIQGGAIACGVIKGRHWRRLGSKDLNSKVIPRWNGGESEVTKKGNSKVNQR